MFGDPWLFGPARKEGSPNLNRADVVGAAQKARSIGNPLMHADVGRGRFRASSTVHTGMQTVCKGLPEDVPARNPHTTVIAGLSLSSQ